MGQAAKKKEPPPHARPPLEIRSSVAAVRLAWVRADGQDHIVVVRAGVFDRHSACGRRIEGIEMVHAAAPCRNCAKLGGREV